MKTIPDISAFCLNRLARLAIRSVCFLALLAARFGDFRSGFKARFTTKRIGSVRLHAPAIYITAMNSAIDKLKEKDMAMYHRLTAGRKLRAIVLGGTNKTALIFEHGVVFLDIEFMKSLDALVSLFVFWSFFQEDNLIRERANQKTLNNRKRQATLRSAEWLEAKDYSTELVQWMRAKGLEKNIVPPLSP